MAGSALTNRVVIDKPITLQSVNGAAVTTIHGKGPNGFEAVRCVWMTNDATLIGFTLKSGATRAVDGREGQGGGIWSSSTNTVIEKSILTGNSAYQGGGAFSGTLINSILIDNSAQEGGGVFECTSNNSIVYFNTNSAGEVNNYFDSLISHTCTTPESGGPGNITDTPLFFDLGTTNLQLATTSPCINSGNNANVSTSTDFAGNPRIVFRKVDMGAYEYQTPPASGAVHYVVQDNPSAGFPYTNWTTAAANIQDAIDASMHGNSVLVSNGVYQTGGRTVEGFSLTNRVVIDKPITVESVHGAEQTTIRGNGPNGNDAVRCVWMMDGATLVGFTLTDGATLVTGDLFDERAGGGAWGGTLNNCVLIGNSADRHGGGAYDATLNNCTLNDNSAIYGGGTHAGTLSNCYLTDNIARYGGGAYSSWLNSCTLTGNMASQSGGGTVVGIMNNCTLIGNSSSNYGGGVSGGILNNCIVVDNTAANGTDNYSPVYNGITINYTCTTPMPTNGVGSITNAPMFVDAANSNFMLMASSPAQDTGNNANAPAGPDLAGNPRIVNGYVDMGAYEYQGSPQGDFDGDGMGNGDERVAGTDFADSNAVFSVSSIAGSGGTSIQFDSVTGRVYAVEYNEDLMAAPQVWIELTNGVSGTGKPIEIMDPSGADQRTFRVNVQQVP